jgi:hypothetical protein
MKTALILFVAAIALPAAAELPSGPTRIAVFDLKADDSVDALLGAKGTGPRMSALLSNDLMVLSQLTVVVGGELANKVGPEALDPSDALTPSQARSAGEATGATNLVFGRIFKGDSGPIFAVKIVSSKTGEALGAMVQVGPGDTLPDALSRLSTQIAKVALSQQGVEAPTWANAKVVGTRHDGGFFSYDRTACVLAVDGRRVKDELEHWNKEQPLLPGLHEVFVRFCYGESYAGHGFVVDAKPGAFYEIRFEQDGEKDPKLWIQERGAKNPATVVVQAKLTDRTHWYSDMFVAQHPYVQPQDSQYTPPQNMPKGR